MITFYLARADIIGRLSTVFPHVYPQRNFTCLVYTSPQVCDTSMSQPERAMIHLTSIVAVNEDGVIGVGNTLPWRVRSDLQFFRDTTLDNTVIMGRKTFDSLGKPLSRRRNIVVTHGFSFFSTSKDCVAVGGIEEALDAARALTAKRKSAFVVGGASMYEQFSPYVDRYLITEIRKSVAGADTFFDPSIVGDLSDWRVKLLAEGKADGDRDEADFRIFELTSRNSNSFVNRRQRVFDNIAGRRGGNSLSPEFARRYA